MGKSGDKFWHSAIDRQSLQRWALSARDASETRLTVLERQATRARALREQLDSLIRTAEERLALPVIGAAGFPKPHNADWTWRPELWRAELPVRGMSSVKTKSTLGSEITLFHDCEHSEITLRQVRNTREEDLAPYGLRLDVFRFDGSFLSLVANLPEGCTDGLKRTHILKVTTIAEMEKPIEIFVRLNIRHGPNTEQIVREMPVGADDMSVEFDLAYANINEKRIDKAWLDFIFEGPEMNMVTLRDLNISRRPRAQI